MRAAPFGVLGAGLWLAACTGWNPSRPFDREVPLVREAVVALDGGDASAAAGRLEEYLSTGPCKDGSIGTPDLLKRRPNGTFDLGLSLFSLGEQFGRRFGEEESEAHSPGASRGSPGGSVSEAARAARHAQVLCARQLVEMVVDDPGVGVELRARARYLDGNLAFLDGEYEEAVRAYDRALVLVPGETDAGDALGRDAAWNRAIALRRIEDKKDAGPDASPDGSGDGSSGEGGGDGGDKAPDAGQDGASPRPDGGDDGGRDGESPPPPPPDAGDTPRDAAPPPLQSNEDQRMLDQLENAPTLQQEEAKRVAKRRVRGMVDK